MNYLELFGFFLNNESLKRYILKIHIIIIEDNHVYNRLTMYTYIKKKQLNRNGLVIIFDTINCVYIALMNTAGKLSSTYMFITPRLSLNFFFF